MSKAQKVVEPSADDILAAEAQIVSQSKRIEFYITEYSVEILAMKVRDGEYEVPAYQREYTWEDERKSRFIESLLMGLPIPFIFFWEMPDGRLEIVDGSQRLRTIEEFIFGGFRLGPLEQLTHVTGLTFKDLPQSRQRKILNRSIRGIILNEHADEAARFDMFARINTGSKIANTAEVRRGALIGPFLDMIIDLSTSQEFVAMTPMSTKSVREREREELVTRFFAYGDGLDDYRDRPSDFLFQYSRKMNETFKSDPALVDEYKRRFYATMKFVSQVFPNNFSKTARSSATPRARFESIAIGAASALVEDPAIASKTTAELGIADWIEDPGFIKVTNSDGANARSRLRDRIEFVRDKLVGKS
ncbi:DUF262 domain-containing protein [Amycolatopsis coloradensis]|uniref:DUF262 domain-containing protein n=1 Tax=Amycolatopsis coloradensis TaxID=76021 RepID=A0ACD5B7Q3_9PSEU